MQADSDDERWMRLALADAAVAAGEGNTAVAAVLVRDGQLLAVSHATQQTGGNPTQHAEVNAIGQACQAVGSNDLSGATLYSTLEPCPMCAWALRVARIGRVVIGARYSDLGRTDLGDYRFEALMAMTKQDVELVDGVLADECIGMRRAWMQRTGRLV